MERLKDCYRPNALSELAKTTGKAGLAYGILAVPLLVFSALSEWRVIDGVAAIAAVLAGGLLGISVVLGVSWYVQGTVCNWNSHGRKEL